MFVVGPDGCLVGPAGGPNIAPNQRGFANAKSETLFMKALGNNNVVDKKAAFQIFLGITSNHQGNPSTARVTEADLIKFVISHGVFPKLSDSDAALTAKKIFKEIDQDGNGDLDFEEFYEYIKELTQEQLIIQYVEKHYLTSLPASIRKSNGANFTIDELEKQLQSKVQQNTRCDTDVFRSILTDFRKQVQNYTGKADSDTVSLNHKNFRMFLNFLGLFTTVEQAQQLFEKYDANGDGNLTVHEFLTKAKAPDYPGLYLTKMTDREARKGGKRIYNETVSGEPVRTQTPNPYIYDMGIGYIKKRIRERLEEKARTGSAFSDFSARRVLRRYLEEKDVTKSGFISTEALTKVFATDIGIIMNEAHKQALRNEYCDLASGGDMVDYGRLVMEVYPDRKVDYQASVIKSTKKTSEKVYKQRFSPAPRNNVFNTGSYWSANTPDNLPPLSPSGSNLPQSASPLSVRGKTHSPISKPITPTPLSKQGSRPLSKVGGKAISRVGSRASRRS